MAPVQTRDDKMKVGVLCEFSGTVRNAFIKHGHEATSYDFLPSETPGSHRQIDILDLPRDYWKQYDLIICHPPCTHLAVSGARWFKNKKKEQKESLEFVKYLMDLPVEKICLENPVSIISTKIRKPDQYIQPWQFGHPETKKTGLWLKNLPPLNPTDVVDGREPKVHHCSPGPDRWKDRSRFYTGIAEAMATQWGDI
jgi:site-specific DNA-cytosine methylase